MPSQEWTKDRIATTLNRDDSGDYQDALQSPEKHRDDPDAERKAKIVEQGLERFKLILEVEGDQRDREVEDLKFDRAFPEDQWPAEILKARSGGFAPDGSVVHERPCLVIPKLDQPVQQVINEARKARLGIIVKPKGARSNKEGAAIRQGMIRAIENDSRANLARIWALERAVKCGRGAYRVLKTYANDGDFDLDLVVKRIKNQGCVYLDPYAQEPDWSDGEFGFITDEMPVSEYKRLYDQSALASMDATELQSVSDKAPQWVTTGPEGTIRVSEYFYVEYEKRTLIFDERQGKSVLLPKGAPVPEGVTQTRPVDKRIVKWCVINAHEVLDEEDWEGRYIPIVPVIGKEYNVDGASCYKGVISNAKDSQRLYNYARSSQALRSGLESLAPWVMAEGQDEGYEAMWDEANTRAFTRLKYKPTTFEGHLVPPPSRNDISSTNISASVLMAREADADIQATTGRFNPSLGKQDGNRSGKAINALKMQGEQSSSNYLENLANISVTHEARILLDLFPYVYDRPGRIVRLMGDEPKDEREVMLHAPFIVGPQGPLSTTPGTPGLISTIMNKMKGGKPPEPPKLYDLRDGEYSVSVSIGQGFSNQQDAEKAFVLGIIQAAPAMAPYLIDIASELEGTGIGERVKKRLQKINPQLVEEEEGGPPAIPPQVQQQLQQLQQQNQQMQAVLQKFQSGAAVEESKIAAAKVMKQMELASRERIEAAKIKANLTSTNATLGSKEAVATMDNETKRGTTAATHQHESRLRVVDAEEDERAALRDAALQPAYPPVQGEREFTPPDETPI